MTQIITKRCKDLVPAAYNPRQLTKKQYADLRESLTRFGCVDPVIINQHPGRENVVIGGHQRLRVWQDMGNTEIPCVGLDLDEDRERELNIRLNRNLGEWDWDILANDFEMDELIEWGFEERDFVFAEDGVEELPVADGGDQNRQEHECPKCGHCW